VLEVDLARKRISLTMKLDAKPPAKGDASGNAFRPPARGERSSGAASPAAPQGNSAMAAAFARLQTKR